MSNQKRPVALDAAIDRAVTEMMQRDTRIGFRGRVLAELGRPRRRGDWRSVPALALASALVLTVIGVLLLTSRVPPERPTPVVSAPEGVSAPPVQPRQVAPPSPPTETPVAPAIRRRPAAAVPRDSIFAPRGRVTAASIGAVAEAPMSATPAAEQRGEVPEQPPIVVEPLGAPTQIVVPPIELRPIPFQPPSGRSNPDGRR